MSDSESLPQYALISPARNEEKYIRKTLDSMVSQSHPPVKWVIVDDGSSDRTAEIVGEYLEGNPWIELLQRGEDLDRGFAAKVKAFEAGRELLKGLQFDVIGNLDADLSFDPDYFRFLMQKFQENPKLGVGGTPFTEDGGYDTAVDSFEGENYVAGGAQLFRKECFEDIDGYVANRGGGIDVMAVVSAKMKGWEVWSFLEKRFHHYRTMGTADRSKFQAAIQYGERAYFLGSSPVWHMVRVVYRIRKRPYVTGALGLFLGYAGGALRRQERLMPPHMMAFYRKEQMGRLKGILRRFFTFRKVDGFASKDTSVGEQSA